MPTAITPEKLAELEAAHKRVAHVHSVGVLADGHTYEWELVLRKPTRTEYKQLRAQAQNERTSSDALEMCVRRLAVFPSPEEVGELFEEWPGIAEACGRAVERLAGVAGTEDRK